MTPPRASPAPDSRRPAWRRGLLKLSGELLAGDKKQGLDPHALRWIADDIKTVARAKRQLAVVTGAGNILRGRAAASVGLERSLADGAGMLGTVINALALHGALSTAGVRSLVLSAFPVGNFVAPYGAARARAALDAGDVVLLAGGTGNPYFSTDSAATLRAAELDCDLLLKATKVDGVYDRDPEKHADAARFLSIDYEDALARGLEVMDRTALAMLAESRIPLVVFALSGPRSLRTAADGAGDFTLLKAGIKTRMAPRTKTRRTTTAPSSSPSPSKSRTKKGRTTTARSSSPSSSPSKSRTKTKTKTRAKR
ncbi:MAG: uridine monophosphate kinase [Alphaproteobacteria bacterium]|nr:uridine monophosphate kinase [Alphaproteobacteria bacterium]